MQEGWQQQGTEAAGHQQGVVSCCTNGTTHLQVLQLLLYPDMDDAQGFSLSFYCTQQALQQRGQQQHINL